MQKYPTVTIDLLMDEVKKYINDEKELYKIVYRYIKGRIDKILINRNEKDLDSKIKDWVNEENLLEKIEKRVKQYTLEHVMYLGKIKHRGLEKEEVNTLKFQELHGQEEFELELITFFSAVNMEICIVISTLCCLIAKHFWKPKY